MPEPADDRRTLVSKLIADNASAWDEDGELPVDVLRRLSACGVLCAEVPATYGGLGLGSRENGELTAHVGRLCSSVRSVMTSQGMAAWTVQRLGDPEQLSSYLPRLTSGQLAAVGFSEPMAGSDLSAMRTQIVRDADSVIVTGEKVWVTGALYADLLMLFGRYGDNAAAVVIPAATPGVRIERVPAPLGCRAAGHANIRLEDVRLPAASVLGGGDQPLSLLITTALSYGRISVAWGCVGILRACLSATIRHARNREQFGKPLAQHQLVARHIAELLAAEQVATRICEYASQCWEAGSSDMGVATVLAKHVSAGHAARGASCAVQVLASAGARDHHVVARAYRDAKLMEIIEGSNEICQVILAQHAMSVID
jgi:methoxymalonate biosynthesis protein